MVQYFVRSSGCVAHPSLLSQRRRLRSTLSCCDHVTTTTAIHLHYGSPRRHGWTHAWAHPTNQTTRSDVRGRGRVATRATLPQPSHARAPTCSRDCGCCRLRHSSTRPSGLPLKPRGVRVGRGREPSWRMYSSSIRNRRTGVHLRALMHAAKNESAVLACQVRSKAQAAGAVEDRRKWNRSDHRVARATRTVNKVSALA